MFLHISRFLFLSSFLVAPQLRSEEPVDIEKLDPNMTLEKADAKGIAWLDPRTPPFRLTGFAWIQEDKVYRRLPVKPDWEIPGAVDSLANSTAGGQIHFQSNSPKIMVRVTLPAASGMYHMPATGQSGFDLYVGEPGAQRFHSTSRFDSKATTYEVTLFEGPAENRHFTLNFPLYNGVKSVEVGVMAKSAVGAPDQFRHEGRIVVYGTSITQGGCAARPGMAYSNILSRRMNMEFVNLGFSGNGKGEPALAHLINQIGHKRIIVLDYEANAGESIRTTLGPFLDLLREADQDIPILVISKIRYAKELADPDSLKAVQSRAEFQKSLLDSRRAAGDSNLYFLDGSSLLGDRPDEGTVDGVHPTDLGFMNMADRIGPVIESLLTSNKKTAGGFPKVKHMIDTHIHLYDTRRENGVPWPPEDDTVLYKPHLPEEFVSVSKPTGLTGVVVVEASDRLEDNGWVLDLVKDDPYFVALVGNIDLYREDFAETLDELAKDKRYVGIRARRKGEIDFSDGLVLKNLRILADRNLSADILVNGQGLAAVEMVDQLAREIPELRIIVDHVLGYDIDGRPPSDEWIAAVAKMSENRNVYCKVSGLYQRCVLQPAPQDPAHYRALLDVLWNHLGKERLLFGSNWPCTKKSGDYASFVQLVNAYFSEKGQDACEHYFWKNANAAYRLGLE